jgi:hypothetical protein
MTLAMWAYALLAILRAGTIAVEALKKSRLMCSQCAPTR